MALLRDDALEKLERSRAYLVVGFIFGWIEGVGVLLLATYSIHWWVFILKVWVLFLIQDWGSGRKCSFWA